jgi:Xaa-Pro dipeptidase
MNTIYEQRSKKLDQVQKQGRMDVIALVPGANLRYLTGLEMLPTERITLALFPAGANPLLILPKLEAPRAEARLATEVSLYPYSDQEGPERAFQQATTDLDLKDKTIGVEHLRMRVFELRQLQQHASGCEFVDGEPLLTQLRIIKDDGEIEAMRRAAEVNQGTFREVQQLIRPGITESELAAAWQKTALDAAGGDLPETPIVASGPNGASPHTTATNRPIEKGDLVIIDGFLRSEGYYSDITRTYAMGEVDEELANIYSIVQEANAAGRETIKPGLKAEEVDLAARQVIERAGYGEYFIHRTGHGFGLEIHEPPYIVEGNEQLLEPGMAFTVEPGIYLPGRGGVRIEDDVVVTEDGCETLTTLPRELMRL